MANGGRPHIFVENTASKEQYSPRPSGGGGDDDKMPRRKRKEHGEKLISDLKKAWEESKKRREETSVIGMGTANGVYLQFKSDPHFELTLKSLEFRNQGVELLSVHEEDDVQIAAVFVPDDKISTFLKRFEQYLNEETDKGAPRNSKLVDSIAELKLATLRTLWTDERTLFPSQGGAWWEVWLRADSEAEGSSTAVLQRFKTFAERAGIRVKEKNLQFVDRVVLLAYGTAQALSSSIDIIGDIAELRLAKETPTFFTGLRGQEQTQWAQDLAKRTAWPKPTAPAVCILDTGVNRAHLLIDKALTANDTHTWDPSWGADDRHGHGTEMAGLALFGDLTSVLSSKERVDLGHRLESVKILRQPGDNTDPELYGAITIESVARTEATAPARQRVFSMAVTGPDTRDRGQPSSWSAEIDALAAGADPAFSGTKRLFVISGGNSNNTPGVDYFTEAKTEPIHDPGQAWNALTVGAYTERVFIDESTFNGWEPLANSGDLTPGTSTSYTWVQSAWPVKPDFVLEGGNLAVSGQGDVDYPESLALLSTYYNPMIKQFVSTGMTSAATAQAARMAAVVQAKYPSAWPETIRGLLVHSSSWTEAMLNRFGPYSTKKPVEELVRCFGMGVPSVTRALESAGNALTLIAQDDLFPLDEEKKKEMAIHKLPWPTAVLQGLGETEVELRVTLSYFIEPNPARRGWTTRYRYASHGLRFDVKTPTESLKEFRKRLNQLALSEGEKSTSESDSGQWFLGSTLRHKGSLHSDIWRGTAAELAARGYIAVFPVLGWWNEKHSLGRWRNGCRYTLIVSISTPRTDVDIYVPVATQVGIPV